MATQASKLSVSTRTEKGKGAARRARREGKVPAVLYGHGTDPQHLHLPARDFAAILRNNGLNAIIDLDIEGSSQLALTKQVDVHPIRNYIEHADLLIVRRGEKVTVEVAIVVEGDAAPGTLVVQDASVVEVEADALSIPRADRRQRRGCRGRHLDPRLRSGPAGGRHPDRRSGDPDRRRERGPGRRHRVRGHRRCRGRGCCRGSRGVGVIRPPRDCSTRVVKLPQW